jgi:hypothetical protein
MGDMVSRGNNAVSFAPRNYVLFTRVKASSQVRIQCCEHDWSPLPRNRLIYYLSLIYNRLIRTEARKHNAKSCATCVEDCAL